MENLEEKLEEVQLQEEQKQQVQQLNQQSSSESLPKQFLGHSVYTTVVSHPPTLLSHIPISPVYADSRDILALENIRENTAGLSIEHIRGPQFFITQPPRATVLNTLVHSPLTLLDTISGSSISSSLSSARGQPLSGDLQITSLPNFPGHHYDSISTFKILKGNGNSKEVMDDKNGNDINYDNINGNSDVFIHRNDIVSDNNNGYELRLNGHNSNNLKNILHQEQLTKRTQINSNHNTNGNGKDKTLM